MGDDDGGERRLFGLSTTIQYTEPSSFLREEIDVGLKQLVNIVHKQGGYDDSGSGSSREKDKGSAKDERARGDDAKGKEVLHFAVPIVFIFFGVVGYRVYKASQRGTDRQRSLSGISSADDAAAAPVPSSLLGMAAMNYDDLDEIAYMNRKSIKDRILKNDRLWYIRNCNVNSSSDGGISSRYMGMSFLVTSTPRASRVLPSVVATATPTEGNIEGVSVVEAYAVQPHNDAVYVNSI